jgi:hypothetical protein
LSSRLIGGTAQSSRSAAWRSAPAGIPSSRFRQGAASNRTRSGARPEPAATETVLDPSVICRRRTTKPSAAHTDIGDGSASLEPTRKQAEERTDCAPGGLTATHGRRRPTRVEDAVGRTKDGRGQRRRNGGAPGRGSRGGPSIGVMFGTLLGALPRPAAGSDGDSIEARIAVAIRAQEAAGLEPITDGRLRDPDFGSIRASLLGHSRGEGPVEGWQFAAGLTDRAVKQALPGPYTVGRLVREDEVARPTAARTRDVAGGRPSRPRRRSRSWRVVSRRPAAS